ncbi:MAG: polysaccharide biosynthesis C-terminal domain-containing protein, partial [Thermoplasmata archaeon]|nr:polysaccharide biosynthesis C-terminal domain-containing protein [Thermoplasmata archaeon]
PAFLAVVVGPSPACLAGVGEFRSLFGCTAVSAVMNLGLSFALIPALGITGAALAWGAARVSYPFLAWSVLYARYGVNPFSSALTHPLAITLGLCASLDLVIGTLHPASWVLVPLYGAGVAISVASLALTRSLVPGDVAVAQLAEQALRRPLPGLRRFVAFCTPPAAASGPAAGVDL